MHGLRYNDLYPRKMSCPSRARAVVGSMPTANDMMESNDVGTVTDISKSRTKRLLGNDGNQDEFIPL